MQRSDNFCSACNEEVSVQRSGCHAMNKLYHIRCFVCTTCGNTLAGSSFYTIDDKPYCEADYAKSVEKCCECAKPIMEKILRTGEKNYHPHCFCCKACSGRLDGLPFNLHPQFGPHCTDCYHEKFSPRCAACRKAIVPEPGKSETLRVVSMDKSFHVDCYKCEDCGLLLSCRIQGHECYPLENRILCKICNSQRLKKRKEKSDQ